MTDVLSVDGALLEDVLDATHPIFHDGLDRQAYGRFCTARLKTDWSRRCQRQFALAQGPDLLAGAEKSDLAGTLDGRAMRICGVGSVFTPPARRGGGHARSLVETLLDRAAREGAEMALLFLPIGAGEEDHEEVRTGFEAIPLTDVTLQVAESPRHGAPMTMVRGGEQRDLPAIAAMGRVRAAPFRFHLDRDGDFVQHAITRKRLRAGFGSAGARELHFFIAEEGTTAAAYVVLGVAGRLWTLEECGDRDASGARVGALLQALIAREPGERRPTIRGWLPPGLLPPQVTAVSGTPSNERVMVRMLTGAAAPLRLSAADVLYWHSDAL